MYISLGIYRMCTHQPDAYESTHMQWIKLSWYVPTASDVAHYGDITMSPIASQITSLTIVYSTDNSSAVQIKQSSTSLAFVTGDRWIPIQRASNAEIVSIWWRHHPLMTSQQWKTLLWTSSAKSRIHHNNIWRWLCNLDMDNNIMKHTYIKQCYFLCNGMVMTMSSHQSKKIC